MRKRWFWSVTELLAALLLAVAPAAAADFPPIAESEKSLAAVAGQPGAPGVVLYKKARLHFRDYPREISSRMEVAVRIKVLTEEGKNLGEVELPHSRQLRLDDFEGRIVRPDGSEQALPKEAIFLEKRSRSRKAFVTRAAFPNVQVGTIIDYRYTLFWDNLYSHLEPWYFHDDLPVLLSEIVYEVPPSLGVQVWGKETSDAKIETETAKRQQVSVVRATMRNLPGLPDEPFSFPDEDLSSRFLMIPSKYFSSDGAEPLLESWKEVSRWVWDDFYKPFLAGDRQVAVKAKELVAGKKERREQIRALYEFVREEIGSADETGVGVRVAKADVDEVLEQRLGSPSEQTLLLYALLDAVGIPAQILWVARRDEGTAEVEVANPSFFQAAILQVEDGGTPLYLDPSDASLGFGRLPPHYESTRAVLMDRKNPGTVLLPASPYGDNSQKADLRLEADAEGRVKGKGKLSFTGNYAWSWLRAKDNAEETGKLWTEKLAEYFPGFEPGAVSVTENLHDQRLDVEFTLAQRAETVLGDEVGLQPARPFVASQPLLLPASRRLTPVLLPFAGFDETRLELTWAPEFELDALPKPLDLETAVGNYRLTVKSDPAARRVEIMRHFARHQHEIHGSEGYTILRKLYEKATQSDAQTLVLVRN